jgi:DNA-binding SARP family transcriptional activator
VLRGGKPRQLLILLAIRANRPVPTEQLIEELWEGDPPPSAATALRVHFGRLRQVLEPDRSPSTASVRLPAGPNGYLLRLEPDELDSERFERRTLAARQANADGDPENAIPHLIAALDMWRGPALVDGRDLSAVGPEISRLDELHGVAFEELADARLALREHALLIDVLLGAVERFPLREKLTGSLMLALYRSGRTSEALRAYADLAKRLDDQLGVVPSRALRQLEEDILLQRPTLDHAEAAALVHMRPPRVRMIGRHKQLRDLLSAVSETSDQSSRVVLIAGPAGIGKSTLVQELRTRSVPEASVALIGSCSIDSTEPYEPIAQVLGQMEDRRSSSTSMGRELSPFDIQINESSETRDPGGVRARFRLGEAVVARLARLDVGTIIVLEDLHWSDRPTLLLLRHLARHPALAGISFVGTYRDDDISGERLELVQTIAPPSQCRSLTIPPFSEAEVRSLVRTISPPESVQMLAQQAATLHRVTEGNPFFLRELLRELDDESIKLRSEDDLVGALSDIAPAGVRALIDRRMDRLTVRSREVAYAAATLIDQISTEILGEVCAMPTDAILEAVEECLAARLLVEDVQDFDQFLFPHAMVRNSVYASIPNHLRIDLHRRVGKTLAKVDPGSANAARIAYHFREAAPLGVEPEAATYAGLAAVEAERHLMFGHAAAWYEHAKSWHSNFQSDDPSVGRLSLALGRACANDKQPDRARQAFLDAADVARGTGDSALLVDVALTADGPWSSGSDLRVLALDLLQEALGYLDESDVERQVRALAGIAAALYYVDHDREGNAARIALKLATTQGEPSLIAIAELALHRWTTHQPTARLERLTLSRSGCKRTTPNGTTGELFLTLQRELLADLLENAEIAEFHETLPNYAALAQLLGSPADIYWAMALRATEATLHGDLALAEQLARGAALRGYEFELLSDGALILQRFLIRYQQARLAEEVPVLRHFAKADTVFRAGAALTATSLSESGRQQQSDELTWRTLGPDGSELPRDVYWLAGIALLGGAAASGRDRDLQRLLAQLLAPCVDHVVVFGVGGAVIGSGHYWSGILAAALGELEPAIDHLRQALAVAQQIDGPFWAAQAQIELSKLLLARNVGADADEGTHMAQAAVATAQQLGFGRILKVSDQPPVRASEASDSSRVERRLARRTDG